MRVICEHFVRESVSLELHIPRVPSAAATRAPAEADPRASFYGGKDCLVGSIVKPRQVTPCI